MKQKKAYRQHALARTAAVAAAIMMFGAPMGAQASLEDADSFDYTAGDNINGKNGGTGWSGAWAAPTTGSPISVNIGSLSFTDSKSDDLDVAGNRLFFNNTAGTANRSTSSTFSGQDIWLGALVRAEAGSNQMQVRMRGTGGDNWARFRSGADDIVLISDNSGTNVSGSDIKGSASVPDNTIFLAMQLERGTAAGGNDTLKAWVNPDVGVSSPNNFDGSGSLDTQGNIGDLSEIRLFASTQGSGGDRFMDEVRVGTSFQDVAPVPEPNAIALVIMVGAIGVALRRRIR